MAESRSGRIALGALSAGLLALPIHYESTWAIAGVYLVPALIACRNARPIEAIALGALVGTLYGIAISLWIPAALQEFGSSRLASLAGLVAASLWAGPPVFGLLGGLSRGTASWAPGPRALVLAAGVFAVEELLGRVWWGVPWGLLGYSQLRALGVAQLAVVGGVPLISALLVAINALLADVALRKPGAGRLAAALAASWIALAVAGMPLAEAVRPTPKGVPVTELLLVQPDLPRGERWGDDLQALNLHRVQQFTQRVLAEAGPGIDALVLPENLLTTPVDASPELTAALDAWVSALAIPGLTGLVLAPAEPDPALYRSAVVWLEPGRGITARIDKERAIPLLESSRRFFGDSLVAALFGEAAHWKKVEEARGSALLRGPIPVTPALCYEALFPDLVARRRTPDSVAIVNLADDSWVPGSAASRHLTNLARIRAIEQRLPLVRVAHGGLSAAFDPFGQSIVELPLDAYAHATVELRPSAPPTIFERGSILVIPITAFGVVAWSWAWLQRMNRTRRMSIRSPAAVYTVLSGQFDQLP